MARTEDYIAKPFPATAVATAVNTAISLVRPAPGIGLQYALKRITLSAWGTAAPDVAPTLTISGGGLAVPLIIVGQINVSGTANSITATLNIDTTVLLLGPNQSYTISVPALGATFTSTLWVLDRALVSQ